MRRPTEDRYVITAGELKDRMAILMGGRAAEQVVFSEFSTGAADDLAKVTDGPASSSPSTPTGHEVLDAIRRDRSAAARVCARASAAPLSPASAPVLITLTGMASR